MKIAIDGPSASGKGTISKLLAKELECFYLNTGKIYRIIAFLASKMEGVLEENAIKVAQEVERHFEEQAENKEIFTEENAALTSKIAKLPKIRELLVDFQRDFAEKEPRVILEGRDIGTVILPNADFKFYLDASAEERAKRRLAQLGGQGDFVKVLAEIEARDENDKNREIAALKPAEDSYYIDTTGMTIEEVLAKMLRVISGKI